MLNVYNFKILSGTLMVNQMVLEGTAFEIIKYLFQKFRNHSQTKEHTRIQSTYQNLGRQLT